MKSISIDKKYECSVSFVQKQVFFVGKKTETLITLVDDNDSAEQE